MSYRNVFIVSVLVVILSFSSYAVSFTDTAGHWGETIIQKWSGLGLINGYEDGSFKPDGGITRAEFITLVNNAFGYDEMESESFSDVDSKDWYYNQVKKANSIGYVSGYEDKTFRPNNLVSRQEAAVILIRIMDNVITVKSNYLYRYYDVLQIPEWSWQYVESAVVAGYLKSYDDQTIRPSQPITRTETIYALEQIIGPAYIKDERYGPESGMEVIEGNAVIASEDVTLRNTEIKGDLYITEGVGSGEVILDNVIVAGRTIVKGGGEDSISIRDSQLNETILNKKDGNIKIEIRGKTEIESLNVYSGAVIESTKLTGRGIEKIMINKGTKNHDVQLKGNLRNIEILSDEMDVILTDGEASDVIIHPEAESAILNINNFEVDDILISDDSSMTLNMKHGIVDQLILNSENNIIIEDSTVKTLEFGEDSSDSDLELKNSEITTFNIDTIMDMKVEETNFKYFNLKEEAEGIEVEVNGGHIEDLNVTEKCTLEFEDVGIEKCDIKRTASGTKVDLSLDSFIETLKVYAKTTFTGRGDVIELYAYSDGITFVETPHSIIADEEYTVKTGNSSYDAYIIWTGEYKENERNIGRVDGKMTATLYNDNFADSVRMYNEVRVLNLPAGLNAEVNRINDTTLEIVLEGLAADHDDADDISNVSIEFYTQAFTTYRTSDVKNYNKKNVHINFND